MLKSIYFHHAKSTKTHTARNKKQDFYSYCGKDKHNFNFFMLLSGNL